VPVGARLITLAPIQSFHGVEPFSPIRNGYSVLGGCEGKSCMGGMVIECARDCTPYSSQYDTYSSEYDTLKRLCRFAFVDMTCFEVYLRLLDTKLLDTKVYPCFPYIYTYTYTYMYTYILYGCEVQIPYEREGNRMRACRATVDLLLLTWFGLDMVWS